MTRFLFLLALIVGSISSAFAAAPLTKYGQSGLDPQRFSSVQAVCDAYAAYATNSTYIRKCIGPVAGTASSYKYSSCPVSTPTCTSTQTNIAQVYKICEATGNPPVNTTLPLEQQCPEVTPPPPNPPASCPYPAGTKMPPSGTWEGYGPLDSSMPTEGAADGFPTGNHECNYQGSPELTGCYSVVENGRKHFYCVYVGVSAGTTPSGMQSPSSAPDGPPPEGSGASREDMPPKASPDSKCPAGSVMAGYNSSGTPMCVGTGTAPPTPPSVPTVKTSEQTTTNQDGSTTKTTTTTKTNADGSTSTTVVNVTTAADGSKTTTGGTTVSQTPSGTAGRDTPMPEQEQVNFCKQNPTLSICRESSVSGSCGAVSCMGDAIQCATLRAAADMQCRQKAQEDELKASPLNALGQAASNGADPAAGTFPTVAGATQVTMPTIEQSGWLGAGAAFADVRFTVQGKSFVVPLREWSGYLIGLRYALMVCASLVSFRMLSGVILRD